MRERFAFIIIRYLFPVCVCSDVLSFEKMLSEYVDVNNLS